ncbi:MAG: carbohydrate kinase family protein [Betaproteobacteria bacterium]|nr:carbohydrate kinase family protein [Betaproteobacteria bacterium]
MRVLICGSMAFDNIMVFQGRFREHILPEQIHMLSVSFLVPQLRREFGGCAGNIAYNLKLLGGAPVIMATVGDDAEPYTARLNRLGITTERIRHVKETLTAQAFITTDLDDNQITAFHPGAMNHSHENKIDAGTDAKLAIVAPDGRDGMVQHIEQLAKARIPFIFDPGQGLPMFSGPDLMQMIDQATYLAVNDYEGKMVEEKTGKSLGELAKMVDALIVTKGASGSTILAKGERHDIESVKASVVVDPTGCGDAYRSGLLYGIVNGYDWKTTGRLASLMGSIKVASRGGQNHHLSRTEITAAYRAAFGVALP